VWLSAAAVVCLGLATPASGQARAGQPPQAGVTPAELQRLFDAYVVMQAQETLQLSDAQYPRFLARIKVLQDVRRRADVERRRIVQELRRMTQGRGSVADEARIRDRLKALDELNLRASAEIAQALSGLDEVLDVQQQARFRVFEELMEQRKVELLMRARQGNRPRAGVPEP
jgi:hypothetical protein